MRSGETAMSAAAGELSLCVMEVLLQEGVKTVFVGCRTHGVKKSAGWNPLIQALAHRMPDRPRDEDIEDRPSISGAGSLDALRSKEKSRRYKWEDKVDRTVSSLYNTFRRLRGILKDEFPVETDGPLFKEIVQYAALVYLHNLRAFLLVNLPWLLSQSTTGRAVRDQLLTPAKRGRMTHWMAVHDKEWWLRSSEIESSYTWQSGLSGRRVKEKLRDADFRLPKGLEDIWKFLLTSRTVQQAESFLRVDSRRYDSRDTYDEILWELLVAEEKLAARPSNARDDRSRRPQSGVPRDSGRW